MKKDVKDSKHKTKGFSLVELLIVIAIILIIAAIAIPNLLRVRRSANEASAAVSMTAILKGQLLFHSTYGHFTSLTGLSKDNVIDEVLGSGTKHGYTFYSAAGANPTLQFTATATPMLSTGATATGIRTYFVDETQVIRFAVGSQATSTSTPVGK